MELWKKRLEAAISETTKYGKYLMNDHASIFLFFVWVGGAILYQKWLSTLGENFPWALIVSVLLALLMNYHPFFSLLKKGDLSFLTPREGTDELKGYVRQAIVSSLFVQILIVGIGFFVMIPLIAHFQFFQTNHWLQLVFLVILLKVWSFFLHQYRIEMQYLGKKIGALVPFIVFVGVFTVLYCTFAYRLTGIVWGILFVLLGVTFLLLFWKTLSVYPWMYWVEKEENRWSFFYRLASQVTQVPSLPVKIKKRDYAKFLLGQKRETVEQLFQYEFSRSWLRMGDYFPIFLRLLLIFWLVVLYFQLNYGALVLGAIILLLYGLQLLPLYHIHLQDLWENVLPIDKQMRKKSFVAFVQQKMLLLGVGMSIGIFIFTFHIVAGIASLVVFSVLSFIFSRLYVDKKV